MSQNQVHGDLVLAAGYGPPGGPPPGGYVPPPGGGGYGPPPAGGPPGGGPPPMGGPPGFGPPPNFGQPPGAFGPPPVGYGMPGAMAPNESLAIASLVCGILSLVCFGAFAGIPAVICGHLGLGKIKRSGGQLRGGGMALAGLIMGYVSLGLTLIVMLFYGAMIIAAIAGSAS